MIRLSHILKESRIEEFSMLSGRWVDYPLASIDREGMNLIWSMYTSSYFKQGLDLSANSAGEMQSKYKSVALKDVDNDNEPDAFIIYKPTAFGNKIALLGTNGKSKAKSDIVKHVIELVKTPGWFLEASVKMEEIMRSSGAPVVKDEELIQKIVGPHKKVQMIGDGYYTRTLSRVDKRITKRIYGRPK